MRSAVVLAVFAGVAAAVPSFQPEPVHEPECPPEVRDLNLDDEVAVADRLQYPYCPGTTSEVHPEPTPYPEETSTEEHYPTETETHYPTTSVHPEEPYPTTTEHPEYTTSTVYTTKIETVTKCDDYVSDCPADKTTYETKTYSLYTTVCPVTTTESHYPTETATETHYPSETHKVVSTYTVCSYCPSKETYTSLATSKPEETHVPYPEDTHVPYPEDTHVPYPTQTHVAPVESHMPYPTASESHYPVYPTGTAAP